MPRSKNRANVDIPIWIYDRVKVAAEQDGLRFTEEITLLISDGLEIRARRKASRELQREKPRNVAQLPPPPER